jgi:hypothetical protein
MVGRLPNFKNRKYLAMSRVMESFLQTCETFGSPTHENCCDARRA